MPGAPCATGCQLRDQPEGARFFREQPHLQSVVPQEVLLHRVAHAIEHGHRFGVFPGQQGPHPRNHEGAGEGGQQEGRHVAPPQQHRQVHGHQTQRRSPQRRQARAGSLRVQRQVQTHRLLSRLNSRPDERLAGLHVGRQCMFKAGETQRAESGIVGEGEAAHQQGHPRVLIFIFLLPVAVGGGWDWSRG